MAKREGGAPSVYSGDRSVPTAKLQERAGRAATGLQTIGVKRGDTIAIYLRNDFPFIEACLAAGMLGAYFVPVNWHYTHEEARYLLQDSDTKVLVIHADLYRRIADAVPPHVQVLIVETPPEILAAYGIDPTEGRAPSGKVDWNKWVEAFPPIAEPELNPPGSMIYTSGTTGRPKGVRRQPRTAEQIEAGAELTRNLFGLVGWEDRLDQIVQAIAGPLYHTAPNGWALSFVQFGSSVVLMPKFDAEDLLREIERRRITHLLAVPTMFVRLLKLPPEVRNKYDLSSLQFVMHGAAPCPPHVKREMIEWWGPVIWEHYGNTETGPLTLCDSHQWLAHPGTVGKVLPDADLKVVDENGDEVPVGQPGEVAAWRKAFADFTYHKDDDKRRKAEKVSGLISLGDIGFLDEEGYLYLSGRASDMVISGGVNIYPAELEAELHKMPGVADCAVFGIPHDELGEQLCAVLQPDPGAHLTPEDVRTFMRGRVAGYKVPKVIEFATDLPREDSGKIFKRKLRAPYWENAGRQI